MATATGTGAARRPPRRRTPRRPAGPADRATLALVGLADVHQPAALHAGHVVQDRVRRHRVPPTLDARDPRRPAYERILATPDTPVLRWFVNSLLAATAHSAARGRDRRARRLRRWPGWTSAARSVMFGTHHRDALRPAGHPDHPQLPDRRELRWLDTLTAVIVPGRRGRVRGVLPPAVLPLAATRARGGGAARRRQQWQIFSAVILPLSKPALVTLAVLAFLTNWNDFLWPVYVLFSPETQTLPPGLSTLQSANTSVRPSDGRRRDRQRAGAAALRAGAAVRHRGRVAVRPEGLTSGRADRERGDVPVARHA